MFDALKAQRKGDRQCLGRTASGEHHSDTRATFLALSRKLILHTAEEREKQAADGDGPLAEWSSDEVEAELKRRGVSPTSSSNS